MKKITFDINARELFSSYTSLASSKGAWHDFTYLYSFAITTKSKVCLLEGEGTLFYWYILKDVNCLFLLGKKKEVTIDSAVSEVEEYFKDNKNKIEIRFYDDLLIEAKEFFPLKEDRNSFEYLYNSVDLVTLEGRKFHAKRSHVKSFNELYPEAVYETKDASKVEEYRSFIKKWQPKIESIWVEEEKLAAIKSLDFINEEGYKLGVIRYKGEIVAFSAGVMLDEKTALIMFEKADFDYKGAYSAINQFFARAEFSSLKVINRDQDLGIDGLRKAKLSYHPSFYKKVYLIDDEEI